MSQQTEKVVQNAVRLLSIVILGAVVGTIGGVAYENGQSFDDFMYKLPRPHLWGDKRTNLRKNDNPFITVPVYTPNYAGRNFTPVYTPPVFMQRR